MFNYFISLVLKPLGTERTAWRWQKGKRACHQRWHRIGITEHKLSLQILLVHNNLYYLGSGTANCLRSYTFGFRCQHYQGHPTISNNNSHNSKTLNHKIKLHSRRFYPWGTSTTMTGSRTYRLRSFKSLSPLFCQPRLPEILQDRCGTTSSITHYSSSSRNQN